MTRILCAVCHKPVEDKEKEYNAETHSFLFKVWCHGDTEMFSISVEDLVDSRIVGVPIAFAPKRLKAMTPETTRKDL